MASSVTKEHYRLEKEAFVSDHGGTTPYEVIFTLLPNVCGILLTTTTLGVFRKCTQHKNVNVIIEFMLIVIPTILCCTVLSEYSGSMCIVMIFISAMNLTLLWNEKTIRSNTAVPSIATRKPFLTNFRALTNIITAICILAVDFRSFPRKFAKTEVYGYSLMDTGVGLFILANAVVAPQTRDFFLDRQTRFQDILRKNLKDCFRNCALLLLLGLGRFVAVELIGYQKHVSEYGVHWNFFVTLAVVKFIISMITSTISSKYSLFSGIWILGMHEYTMNTKGLKTWVLGNSPRDEFFSANREGLISVPGYVGLYFLGIAVGRIIYSTYQKFHTKLKMTTSIKLYNVDVVISYNASILLCIKLSFICAIAYIATLFCDSYFKVSRRLANAGYCLWILSLTVLLLMLLLLVDFVLDLINHTVDIPYVESKKERGKRIMLDLILNVKKDIENKREENKEYVVKKSLEIFDAVNYNSLFFFLLSNVMTGLVNLVTYTLYVKDSVAVLILIVYMAITIFSALVLYRFQVQIKL
ncbi:phosphatidylinositol-glycan biosynthesis class W protein-like isoform X2 [Pseudomyrmex gracilis]|nr:phosphatidylinositol-glycan biosynthesis class W protein-like isoform X2 [Pseudomyrmex gracilis]XP_020280540.1 phosphatidylinositol-glycan biosynthesis class W protein-like isoform X2 [Pseudomyrmex gracilis]XP_020280541.1 phosphatidylinositol-glycan biosynthesis class W protein-like isoform X2 [Pseudomyrmex gracilis]XP_020280542.1 phosphatidylinositol-glycan biosynthesis class W protein-like isoform X2 [Pseudomyrmex gracilis]XP_020280543.1 phosphatidylinositol-glycan biosynthesis class W pro